ncbi:MAG TPA: transcriptional regulator GcvA [Methylomirabilota bacterium]|nr:transcriptional regulator GcvA [Methylomirabilota bacterium]
MARHLPPLNALRAFEAAARHLSFTKAARELHVTQAAVSHQIKGLEEYLGVPLFHRHRKAVLLTEAGQLCLPGLRDGFDRLAAAIDSIRNLDNANVLTVTTPPSFAAKWLVPHLDQFRKAHPDYEVRIDASTNLVDFERENVDVAIRYGSGSYPGLESELLFEIEVFPVCSPRLCKGRHPLRSPQDLKWHTLLHTEWRARGEEPDWRMWLLAAGAPDVDWSRGPQFNDVTVAIQSAIEGQGVALGRGALVAADLKAGRLVRPFRLSVAGRFRYYLVYPAAALKRPKVAAFRDWLLQER